MGFGKSMAVVLLAACLLTLAGCGSAADSAAQELIDIMQEIKSNPASMLDPDLKKRMEAATETLEKAGESMSAEEKIAFKEKWEPKFKEAMGDMGGMGGPAGFPQF